MEESRLAECIEAFLEQDPFVMEQHQKDKIYSELMPRLHRYHLSKCGEYRNICQHFGHLSDETEMDVQDFEQFMPLPVSLFKKYLLSSVEEDAVYKILASSGTTGSIPSRVPLDRQTAEFQQTALAKIMTSFLGSKRMPMLIIDHEQILKGKAQYSARAAGILGF